MDIGISIVVTFVLVLVNGYFSMSEMALVNAKHVLLQKEADEGDTRAARALGLAQDSGQFLATIQVAITLVGFAASAAAATNLSDPLAVWMQGFGIEWLSVAAPVVAPVFITLVVSYLSIVVGELVPKRMALADPERVSKNVAGPLAVFQKLASPLVRFTSASANGLACLLRIKNCDENQGASEEEIKLMVADNDELLDDEKRMIHEIIEMGDTSVHEIMQPRVDMILVECARPSSACTAPAIPACPCTTRTATASWASCITRTSSRRSWTAAPTSQWAGTPTTPCSCPKPRTFSRCCLKCKRIVNRWPSWWTSTGEPMV